MDRRTLIAVLTVALVLAGAGLGAVATTSTPGPEAGSALEGTTVTVTATNDSSTLWPYTSRSTSAADRTLAINVLVYGDTTETRQFLETQSQGEWNASDSEHGHEAVSLPDDAVVGTPTAWGVADGSTRYVYVGSAADRTTGRWLDESYQLHDGDYFGSRHHVRAYETPRSDEEWTAIQAHREHWDWFRLSHKVDSVESSQRYVEAEFMDHPGVTDVRRVNLRNAHGSDADGWVTVIDHDDRTLPFALAAVGLLLPAMFVGRTDPIPRLPALLTPRARRALPLFGSLVVLYLFVRFGAIAVETLVPGIDPRLIALTFYPLVLVGLPAVTYAVARPTDPAVAFGAAAAGFIVAIALDYTALGVVHLPLAILVHRFAAAIALGLIAVGASRARRVDLEAENGGYVRTGALLWLAIMAVPLLRFL